MIKAKLRGLLAAIWGLVTRGRMERELDDELRFHVEMETDKNMAAGMTAGEARRAALISFGGVEKFKEQCRETRGSRFIEDLGADLRYGARMLVKNRAFSLLAIVALAVGIGANSAIFSLVNTVLLRPLPYPQPERLVTLEEKEQSGKEMNTSFATFAEWHASAQSFQDMSLYRTWSANMAGNGNPERVNGLRVSSTFFRVLGIKPVLGRDFLPAEDTQQHRSVVVLSHGLWQRRFGGDERIIGQPIKINGSDYTVVGIMPANFQSLFKYSGDGIEVWAPLGYDASLSWACRTCRHLHAIARLKPGVSLTTARAEMNTIAHNLKRTYPQDYPAAGAFVTPLQKQLVGEVEPLLYILLGAVVFVLLIVCANLANLLLAQGAHRQRELAIRAALGASRGRIVRQLLTESLLLSLLGGIGGIAVMYWSIDLLVAMSPDNIPRLTEVSIDNRVLLFALALSISTGLCFGTIPAFQATAFDLHNRLKESARSTLTGGRRRLFNLFVISEMALALLLLVGAGLTVRSFYTLMQVHPGFDSSNLLRMQVSLNGPQYSEDEQIAAYYQKVMERTKSLPGLESAALCSQTPFGGNFDMAGVHIEEHPVDNPGEEANAERFVIAGDYLRALRIPLLRGRDFATTDGAKSPLVVIINEKLARRYWPNSDPIGKRIKVGGTNGPWRIIIGVVGDVRHGTLDHLPKLQVYLPHAQMPFQYMDLLVRGTNDTKALINPVQQAVWSIDRAQPLSNIDALESLTLASIAQKRFTMALLTLFALAAIFLAAIGIYGVISYCVTQRTQELGIRMALGARPADILKLVMSQGLLLIVAGTLIGITLALVLACLLESLIYGITAQDPLTIIAVTLIVIVSAGLACYLPARRATKIDPTVALRYE